MSTPPTFRVVSASTGTVVQCDCGWYAPVWGFYREPEALHAEHVRVGCYAEPKPMAEWTQKEFRLAAKTAPCPKCGAAPGGLCRTGSGQVASFEHDERIEAARLAGDIPPPPVPFSDLRST